MIICTGFYNRSNLGDDIFQILFKKIFFNLKLDCKFISLDDLKTIDSNVEAIILGGGEILNKYFLSKLQKLLISHPDFKGKIIAYSCELPKGDIIDEVKLIDYFILRNPYDVIRLRNYFSTYTTNSDENDKYIQYIPDLVLSLEHGKRNKSKNNRVSVCLARSIFSSNPKYLFYLKKIVIFLKYIHQIGYQIDLVPFNTSNSISESDLRINMDLAKLCEENEFQVNNIVPEPNMTPDEYLDMVIEQIKKSDIMICSRYHSHILSALFAKPIISIPHTKKVLEQMKTFGLEHWMIEPELDNFSRPVDWDVVQAIKLFDEMELNYKNVRTTLKKIKHKKLEEHEELLNKLIKSNKRTIPPYYISSDSINNIIKIVETNTIKCFGKYGILSFNQDIKNNDEMKERLCRFILYLLCRDQNAPYFYGLSQKIFKPDFNFREDFSWIIRDFYSKNSFDIEFYPPVQISQPIESWDRVFNLTHIAPHMLANIHRSGWYSVVHTTGLLNNPNGVILDMFVDRTFHWGEETFLDLNLIPYDRPWIGIVHHTPDQTYTPYNTTDLIKKESWIKSLDNCLGLFVMSDWLKKWFETNVPNLKVETLVHPTEIPEIVFSFDKYQLNPNKKIVQVGGWLRKPYSIYRIKVPYFIQKTHLIGKNMESYIKPNYSFEELIQNNFEFDKNIITISNDGYNKYTTYMNQYIEFIKKNNPDLTIMEIIKILNQNHLSVQSITQLDNKSYDELLSQNIVFIDLIEASASNTLIECIVRNTPIIVNPIEPVIERLGPNYPLYFTSYEQIPDLLCEEKIKQAYEYLLFLDKKPYKFETWIESIRHSKLFKQAQSIVYPELDKINHLVKQIDSFIKNSNNEIDLVKYLKSTESITKILGIDKEIKQMTQLMELISSSSQLIDQFFNSKDQMLKELTNILDQLDNNLNKTNDETTQNIEIYSNENEQVIVPDCIIPVEPVVETIIVPTLGPEEENDSIKITILPDKLPKKQNKLLKLLLKCFGK